MNKNEMKADGDERIRLNQNDAGEWRFFRFLAWCFGVLLVVAAGLCILADREHAKNATISQQLKHAENTRRAMHQIAILAQNIVAEADRVPVEHFKSAMKSVDSELKIQKFANAAFVFCVNEQNCFADLYGCLGLGADPEIDLSKRDKVARKIFAFADARIPLAGSAVIPSDNEKEKSWENILGPIYFFKAGEHTPWSTRQPRHGVWAEISRSRKLQSQEAFSSGFRAELFRGNIFLVREIRTSLDKRLWIQGFFLNKEIVIGALNEKLATMGIKVDLSNDTAHTDFIPAGIPLKILPLGIASAQFFNEDSANFRLLLIGGFVGLILICAGTLFFLFLILKITARQRLFAAAVAHDLRAPLAGLEAQAERLAMRAIKKSENSAGFSELAQSTKILSEHLNNILILTQITNAHRNILPKTQVVFGKIIDPIFDRVSARLERDGIDFDCDISEPAKTSCLFISPSALERIFFNLADNAAKYAKPKNCDAVFSINATVQDGFLLLSFSDNGQGISSLAREHLFSNSLKTRKPHFENGNLGIGLSLSRELARMMNGELSLKKSDTTGTTFLLKLKLARGK